MVNNFYEMAWEEFHEYRDKDFWVWCLTECEMDEDSAKSLYIREAALRLEEEHFKERRRVREEDDRISDEVESEIREELDRHEDYLLEKDKDKLSSPWLGALLGMAVGYFFFSSSIVEGSDGVFSSLWGWLVSFFYMVASASLFASFCIWFRWLKVSHYPEFNMKYIAFSIVAGVPSLLFFILKLAF